MYQHRYLKKNQITPTLKDLTHRSHTISILARAFQQQDKMSIYLIGSDNKQFVEYPILRRPGYDYSISYNNSRAYTSMLWNTFNKPYYQWMKRFENQWSWVTIATDAYEKKTGRRYSIEYALIRDINDQSWRADLLGRLLKSRNAHVNLIPLNPTPGSKWTASRREDEEEFVRILEAYGVPVTVRDTRGREIDGACGQLAAAEKSK